MKIIKQIIEMKMKNSRELFHNKITDLSVLNHISAYMHSLIFLGLNDEDIDYKKRIWNRFFNSTGEDKLKYYKKLNRFRHFEDEIIMRAFHTIEEEKSKISPAMGSLYRDGVWAILSFEHEMEE